MHPRGDEVEVTIHELAQGGDGVGRLPEGEGVVFVAGAAPGDRVRVRVPPASRRRKGWSRGHLLAVLEPGPARRKPPCPLAARCGGCQWQQVPYAAQLAAKRGILERALRQARLALPPIRMEDAGATAPWSDTGAPQPVGAAAPRPEEAAAPRPVAEGAPAGAPGELGYRCRARLRGRRGPDGSPTLGFRAARAHAVVDVAGAPGGCLVLQPGLSRRLPALRDALPPGAQGELRLLGSPAGEAAAAWVGTAAGAAPGGFQARELLAAAAGALAGVVRLEPAGLRQSRARRGGPPRKPTRGPGQRRGQGQRQGQRQPRVLDQAGQVELNLAAPGEAPFWGAPHLFAQANPAVNARLRQRLARWAAPVTGPILELYAGSGNLTRELAALSEVTAVESDPAAAALAQRNLAGSPVHWRCGDVAAVLDEGRREKGHGDALTAPELVVLDPPRQGALEVLAPLLGLAVPRILYVSCDAMTFARDVGVLAQGGYALEEISLLDTMPQTAHFELIARLARTRRS